jgi:large subunit ribosomal protein L13
MLKTRRRAIRWRLVDAQGAVLGRLAARAARALMGKDSPDWTPHADHRDGLIVINAEKILLTGRKKEQKIYRTYSGYPGGLKEITARHQLETKPERVVREAILGMLPKNRLGARLGKRVRVYAGANFPHEAQQPEKLNFGR